MANKVLLNSVVNIVYRNENIRLKEALADLVVRYDVVKKLETHRISPMHESYIRYSAEEKESIVLTVKRSEPEYFIIFVPLKWEKISNNRWNVIMRKDFMNHWIISHPKTYI